MDIAALIGIIAGDVLTTAILPWALISYGRSSKKSWAVVTGLALYIVLTMGSVTGNSGKITIGHLLALALIAYALFKKTPEQAP